MKEHWIEYNGRYFTPLEFAEFVARDLPDAHGRAIKQTLDNIKQTRELVKLSRQQIEETQESLERLKGIHPPDTVTLYNQIINNAHRDIERYQKWIADRESRLIVLMLAAPDVSAQAKALLQEIDALK